MKIGMIGFGRFGKLMAGYLARDFEVLIYNRSDKTARIREIGATPASLAEVCGCGLVILSVPISRMKSFLTEIAPLLAEDAIVADVCSVKEYPVQWMREILPESVSILATHPMFGPDSAAESLHDRKIVLCPERIESARYEKIKSYLVSKGLIPIETTPGDHDRQIAVSLSLTHFIGRALDEFGAKELIIDTEGYKRLLRILDVVTHDTWQLFTDMNRYNPYAAENRAAFMDAMKTIEEKLDQ
ncbi:prephenate dehydrogenase/arogenate dehydrogenase family protein [Desulfonema ishimotonii]|uniref:Prephenate dehydrogenase/arogenate dehydrogenase family protein n=1 Tax=Desulfonema ishimotonii TaxID=45657 RepID=A0A401FWV4_9BACT|nr:prephenate dehydrogenase/arogenate dehydrogenase family protein [Desulfonema ishimotonii]GBC61423.1 prephenate dehydrogenase/arogenate dehydrogenase family protein [Desulfonema ishimotonii]